MVDEETINDFALLFRGRTDVYGSWEGSCIKSTLRHEYYSAHLSEGPYIGVYPCIWSPEITYCYWGCTDIDYDGPADAWLLHDALDAVDVPSWVEKTRRGYHIWVFSEEAIDIRDMRHMYLAAHQVTGLNPKEVNPKQDSLEQHQVGNYVRLPYPASGALGERMMIRRDGSPIPLDEFVASAVESRIHPQRIIEVAKYYKPPKVDTANLLPPSVTLTETVRILTPLGRTIFRDGPIEGRDRSTTLAHLAFECRKASLNPADALRILEDADLRWGKYMTRGSTGQKELAKLVERAYGSTQSS